MSEKWTWQKLRKITGSGILTAPEPGIVVKNYYNYD
jgi:hypothetical protein